MSYSYAEFRNQVIVALRSNYLNADITDEGYCIVIKPRGTVYRIMISEVIIKDGYGTMERMRTPTDVVIPTFLQMTFDHIDREILKLVKEVPGTNEGKT